MADLATTPRHGPLDGRSGGSSGVTLTPVAPASRLSLRARGEAAGNLATALAVDLPQRPKTCASKGPRHALWLGPDEWLVLDESGADLVAAAAKATVLHSAVDISHRNTAITVSGKGAEATLSTGCPQDLSNDVFPVGACSRTLLGKIEVVIWRRSDDTYHVECWRSFAGYAFAFLEEASRDAAA